MVAWPQCSTLGIYDLVRDFICCPYCDVLHLPSVMEATTSQQIREVFMEESNRGKRWEKEPMELSPSTSGVKRRKAKKTDPGLTERMQPRISEDLFESLSRLADSRGWSISDVARDALAEWVEAQGRNAFMEISVPDAALRLVQASGRLLRTEQDEGRVTLMDRRILTRRYGRAILDSLPPFRRELPPEGR